MLLEESEIDLSYVLRIAHKYYDEKTYEHAVRVMQYVAENVLIPYKFNDDCLALAITHDLWEDTSCPKDAFGGKRFAKALTALTKRKGQDYIEYIDNIKSAVSTDWGMCAWYVKLADMKDHLMQTETLTDKLKGKYLSALPHLL